MKSAAFFTVDLNSGSSRLSGLHREWRPSYEISTADAVKEVGKPDWAVGLKPGAQAIATKTLEVKESNLNVTFSGEAGGISLYKLLIDGGKSTFAINSAKYLGRNFF